MATADNQNFGLVADKRLVQIELHPSAPTPVQNEADRIFAPAGATSSSTKTNIYGADQNAAILALLSSFSINKFHIFRTMTPTNKIGGQLSDKELAQFTLEDFTFEDGQFLLDLGRREENWVRVRTIDNYEGWAHARRLQALENPWSLLDLMSFLQFHVAHDAWMHVEQ
jgi:hypothetical protein